MKPPAGFWGIDLGQCGLKALRLEEQEGTITATAFDFIEHPKILSQPDADPDELAREALEKFLSRNNLKGDGVAVSVPGQSGLARFVKLPPVEEKKIADIVRFEAKQQIPFNLDEVIWDYQRIGSGEIVENLAMDYEIGLFAMKRDQVQRSLQHYRDVGIDVDVIQMAPLALCNFVSYDLLGKGGPGGESGEGGKPAGKSCIVALDMGADGSNLIITNGDRIIWQKPVTVGGNHFTRALTKALKLTFAKAEHTKKNATKSPHLRQILTALKPVLNDLVNELQRSLGYFANSHRDAQIEYLLGLGNAFKLPGLQKYLEEKLQLSVKRLQKMKRVKGESILAAPVFTENIMSFAVAYGLAIQGLKQSKLSTNLLPNEIRVERLIKAKKPWAVAAAAALLLGLGGAALGKGLDYQTYTNKDLVTAMEQAKSTVGRVQQAEQAYKTQKTAAETEEVSVKSIVAGQEERVNWLDLLRFVTQTIPQPDGSNLKNPRAFQEYFEKTPDTTFRRNAMSGKEAFREFQKRQQGTGNQPATDAKLASDPLGIGIDDLIQVNVQKVDSRYTDDLDAFWKNLRTRVTERVGPARTRPLEHWRNHPKGKGWVVEIRGYTFHNRNQEFLMDTFVENIVRMGMPDHGKKPAAPAVEDPTLEGEQAPAAVPDKGPVINRISHVILFDTLSTDTSDTSNFYLINRSVLDDLLLGGTGVSGEGQNPMASPMAVEGGAEGELAAPTGDALRASWIPLGGAVSPQAGFGLQDGMGERGGIRIPMDPMGPTENGTNTRRTSTTHKRVEFVILFVWIEPTPSDDLRGFASPEATDPYGAY